MIYSLTSWSDSSEESAQTSLYVLLSDDAPPDYSGAEFSYYSGSMKSESPNARDMAKLEKLVDISRELIDLSGS